MFQINYEVAKSLTEERRALARRYSRVTEGSEPSTPLRRPEPEEADVIELAFGTYCESEKIGA